jgi:hypothetical protein
MKQNIPNQVFSGYPCITVGIGCAYGSFDNAEILIKSCESDGLLPGADFYNCIGSKGDRSGYCSLKDANTIVRRGFDIKKAITYKRGERPSLSEFAKQFPDEKALICVAGHFIYYHNREYDSFFNNENDPVIKVWLMR